MRFRPSKTLVFGGFGLSSDAEKTKSFLDLAKVFAGGVVGSAGTSALAVKRRSARPRSGGI
jgi:hypothetical protein